MIQHHTCTVNGLELHYAEAAGSGAPLVILHGLSGSHEEFMHLVPALTAHAHVYVLDLRGHGLSAHAPGNDPNGGPNEGDMGYTLVAYARDVAAFIRQVVGQPVVLLGHSLGGLVAGWLAAKQPALVRRLVAEDSPFYLVQTMQTGNNGFYTYFMGLHTYLTRYHATGGQLDDLIAYVGQVPVGAPQTALDPAGIAAVRMRAVQLEQLDPAALEPVLVNRLYGAENPDDLLAQIRCPVHLLVADIAAGGAVSAQELARVLAHLPQASHTFFPDAGHDIHLEQPDALLGALLPHLAAQSAARA